MKKSFKLFLGLLLIGGFALSFSSCKDSENVGDDPNSPESIALSKQSESAQALLSVLSYTSGLDSLPDNWASNSYTVEPKVGVVKDESTPYVRYIVVNDKQEAIDTYNAIAEKTLSEDVTSDTWSIQNVGSLALNVLDQSDVTATLDINIKQQPHLTQIRFVPADAMGDNAWWGGLKEEPYYQFGDVISLKEGSKTTYWICARPCSQISNKKQSHWFSFNLLDYGEEEANLTAFNKTGYSTMYLPTKLGNKHNSSKHIKDLFKLLLLLDDPTKYGNATFEKGIGEIKREEFTQYKLEQIASMWTSNNLWKRVSPSNYISQNDFHTCFAQDKEVNVFYNGYSYVINPSVWMVTLTGSTLETESRNGNISWKRTVEMLNFKNYVTHGYQSPDMQKIVNELPLKGFIVRYKSGAELADASKYSASDNDPNPGKSLQEQNSNIKDVYTYKASTKTEEGATAATIGDVIYKEDGNTKGEVCILNSTENTNYQSVFVSDESVPTTQLGIASIKIAQLANLHILNLLIKDSEVYNSASYNTLMPNFTNDYIRALDRFSMTFELYDNTNDIASVISFKMTGADGKELQKTSSGEIKAGQDIWFTITYPYEDGNSNSYKLASITYSTATKKYSNRINVKSYLRNDNDFIKALSIKCYKDINATQPAIDTKNGQKFKKIETEEKVRKSFNQAFIDFYTQHYKELF